MAPADVQIDEVVVGVRISLGLLEVGACRSIDRDNSATVMVDEIMGRGRQCVGRLLIFLPDKPEPGRSGPRG
jgi:hypothetical protein